MQKGRLTGTRVYLAGPVDNDPSCRGWRDEISEFLESMGIIVYSPLNKPSWLNHNARVENPHDYYRALQVTHSDWAICYLPKSVPTTGTHDELKLFEFMNKPVLFCSPDSGMGVPSVWTLSQFADVDNWENIFFSDWESLKEYISSISNGYEDEELDK